MALSTLKKDGTGGTATVELTYENGKETRRRYGCIVKNDANLKSFIKMYIKQSADKTKFKESKYFVCIYDPDFEEKRNEATVRVFCHRFSKPSQPKESTLDSSPHNFVKVQGHIFFPIDSKNFNDSTFLEKHSKKILEAQDLLTKVIFGLTYDKEKHSPKFIPLKLDHQLPSNVHKIGATVYEKLEDAGPVLLQDNKTVVGSLKKRGNNEISISIFGNNQEITTASSTDGAPGDEDEDDELHPLCYSKEFRKREFGKFWEEFRKREFGKFWEEFRKRERLKREPFQEECLYTRHWDEELHRKRERLAEEHLRKIGCAVQVNYRLGEFIKKGPEDFRLACRLIDVCGLPFVFVVRLANRLNAPPLIIAICKSNAVNSPTLELMQFPKVSTLSVNNLVGNLREIYENDVANLIEKEIPENERNCQLNAAIYRYERLFKEVATMLDKETRNNWRILGSKFGLQGDELEQIERNPARILLEDYVYPTMDAEDLTYGSFQQLVNVVNKPSPFLRDSAEYDCRSMKDVFPPSSEEMWRLCLNLNKSKAVGGLKKWEQLAACWGIKPEIYSQFDPSQKTSPTEILLRWLVGERPDFTVNELCYHLGEIGCHDAKVFLEEKLKEWPLQKEVYV